MENQILSYFEKDLESQDVSNFERTLCHDKPNKILIREYQDVDCNITIKRRTPLFCNSPYCDGELCLEQRIFRSKQMFKLYFYAYPTWRTKRNRKWLHCDLGFTRSSLPGRKELADMKRQAQLYLLKLARRYRIKGIGVRDLSHDVEQAGEEFFIHFHLALRPFFNFRDKEKFSKILKEFNDIGLQMGIKFNLFSEKGILKDAEDLIDYFAKRHAGQFEHKYNKTSWTFSDIMNAKTYVDIFKGSKKMLLIGFSRKEKQMIKIRFLEFLKCEAFELSSKGKDATACDNLDFSKLILVRWYIEDLPPAPPPDLNKINAVFEIVNPFTISSTSFKAREKDNRKRFVGNIDIKKFAIIKTNDCELPQADDFKVQKETDFENMQKRLERIFELKSHQKIKLSFEDKIKLAIEGRC